MFVLYMIYIALGIWTFYKVLFLSVDICHEIYNSFLQFIVMMIIFYIWVVLFTFLGFIIFNSSGAKDILECIAPYIFFILYS